MFVVLHSAYSYVVKAHGKELVKTDIQIKVPHGTYGRVAPRSGLAWKNFIDVGGMRFVLWFLYIKVDFDEKKCFLFSQLA